MRRSYEGNMSGGSSTARRGRIGVLEALTYRLHLSCGRRVAKRVPRHERKARAVCVCEMNLLMVFSGNAGELLCPRTLPCPPPYGPESNYSAC